MLSVAPENTFALPIERDDGVPTCHHSEALWFKNPVNWSLENDVLKTLITQCIGTRHCPTRDKWAAVVIAGSAIATLTGKYLVLPGRGHWVIEANHLVWEALWRATEEDPDGLHVDLTMVLLRAFLPRATGGGPLSHGGFRSNFEENWFHWNPKDTDRVSIGNLRQEFRKEGQRLHRRLPVMVKSAVNQVAGHAPTMLQLTNAWVRDNASR